MSITAYNNVDLPNVKKLDITYNSPNVSKTNVKEHLVENQAPLGSQFNSYLLNTASNYWTLDPFQYSITKFKYSGIENEPGAITENMAPVRPLEGLNKVSIVQADLQNDPGLIYNGVNFEKLLPAYTSTKKSVNDFPAQSYHRFEANNGYFNPNESLDNRDLWYYGADQIAHRNEAGVAGAPLNVQEVNHIVFPEAQRGGLNSKNLAKYSWTSVENREFNNPVSWEGKNMTPVTPEVINNDCEFFNYNKGYSGDKNNDFNKVYSFDSNYCRDIGISSKYNGSMPFNPENVN